jgi:predicted ATPase
MIIAPAEMKAATPDFTDDIEGICERLMAYCPKLLLEHDPDMFFWIIVSSFIDFPSVPSPSYYSSGQRRMISMIEVIMNSEPGTVFLVDEPELSLHIDWQRRFIDQIRVLGGRLVLATHSPDIIYNHTEKVVEVPPRSEV